MPVPSIARNISDTNELVASPSFISNIRRSFLDAIFIYTSRLSCASPLVSSVKEQKRGFRVKSLLNHLERKRDVYRDRYDKQIEHKY